LAGRHPATADEQRFFGFFLQNESARRLKDIGALQVSKTLYNPFCSSLVILSFLRPARRSLGEGGCFVICSFVINSPRAR
jgi:hypothetical protein